MAAPKHPRGNAGKGRPRGVPNKATGALREVCQGYTAEAVAALAAIMRDAGAPPAARVSAATAILDRGHGRPTQPIAGDDEAPPLIAETDPRRLALALFNIVRGPAIAANIQPEQSSRTGPNRL